MTVHNSKFVNDAVSAVGPHAVLGEMLQRLTPIEAQLLVMTSASHLPSTVAQNILRDVLNRYRLERQGVPT